MNKPRLIDANEYLEKVCTYKETGCGSCKFQDCCPKDQPTAYDIDKVVEQLEVCEATCNGRNRRDEYKDCNHEGGCAGCVDCKTEDAYRIAIKIVKGGAVDDETMA